MDIRAVEGAATDPAIHLASWRSAPDGGSDPCEVKPGWAKLRGSRGPIEFQCRVVRPPRRDLVLTGRLYLVVGGSVSRSAWKSEEPRRGLERPPALPGAARCAGTARRRPDCRRRSQHSRRERSLMLTGPAPKLHGARDIFATDIGRGRAAGVAAAAPGAARSGLDRPRVRCPGSHRLSDPALTPSAPSVRVRPVDRRGHRVIEDDRGPL